MTAPPREAYPPSTPRALFRQLDAAIGDAEIAIARHFKGFATAIRDKLPVLIGPFAQMALDEYSDAVDSVLGPELDQLARELTVTVGVVTREAMQIGATHGQTLINIPVEWDINQPEVDAFLRRQVLDLAKGLDDTTRQRLAVVIRRGVREGQGIAQIQREIMDAAKRMSVERARLIAQTECLSGDTLVSGAHVTAAYRRWYEGDIVEIETRGGYKFTATPNHPMLTVGGWIPVGELVKGDDLVCDRFVQGECLTRNPNVERNPATIREIFDTASAIGLRERERGRKPDFHGDGGEGNVDIARPARVLRVGQFAPLFQPMLNQVLAPADRTRARFCEDCGALFPVNVSLHFRRCPCCDTPLSQFFSDVAIGQPGIFGESHHSLTAQVAVGNLIPIHIGSQHRVNAAVLVERLPSVRSGTPYTGTVDYFSNPPGRFAELCSNLNRAQSFLIETDDVVRVTVRHWHGYVYNLSTSEGYFTTNGFYTGNTLRGFNAGAMSLYRKSGLISKILYRDGQFGACAWCRSLDGKIIRIDAPDGFSATVNDRTLSASYPPLHPGCRCAVAPVLEEVSS